MLTRAHVLPSGCGSGPVTRDGVGRSTSSKTASRSRAAPWSRTTRAAGARCAPERSVSCRSAKPTGSHRMSACATAVPGSQTTTAGAPGRAMDSACARRVNANCSARKSGSASHVDTSRATTAAYPEAAIGSQPGVAMTMAAASGTCATRRSALLLTSRTPGKAFPNCSSRRSWPMLTARHDFEPQSGQAAGTAAAQASHRGPSAVRLTPAPHPAHRRGLRHPAQLTIGM